MLEIMIGRRTRDLMSIKGSVKVGEELGSSGSPEAPGELVG